MNSSVVHLRACATNARRSPRDHATITRRTGFLTRPPLLKDNAAARRTSVRSGDDVPVITRGRGFVVEVYFFDHAPPHVHVRARGQRVVLAVTAPSGATIIAGTFADPATERRVLRWAQHRAA